MKIQKINGDEYMKQVREFLERQGYTVAYPSEAPSDVYKVRVSNANTGSVWVRAEHGGSHFGHMAFAGLYTALTHHTPAEWKVEKQNIHADRAHVYLVTLPKVEPMATFDIKG